MDTASSDCLMEDGRYCMDIASGDFLMVNRRVLYPQDFIQS